MLHPLALGRGVAPEDGRLSPALAKGRNVRDLDQDGAQELGPDGADLEDAGGKA